MSPPMVRRVGGRNGARLGDSKTPLGRLRVVDLIRAVGMKSPNALPKVRRGQVSVGGEENGSPPRAPS
jgi:hypothetical protein